jgi:hypothetical protein
MQLWLVRGAGIATLGFAVFHAFMPRFMDWKADLESLFIGNRKVVIALNVAVIYLLLAMGLLSVLAAPQLLSGGMGSWLLWGMGGFWAVRTLAQAFIFGYEWKPSYALTAVFVAVTAAYVVAVALP